MKPTPTLIEVEVGAQALREFVAEHADITALWGEQFTLTGAEWMHRPADGEAGMPLCESTSPPLVRLTFVGPKP